MIKEFDKVRIRENGLICTVVDIFEVDGTKCYEVESDTKVDSNSSENIGGSWPLYTCTVEELEEIE